MKVPLPKSISESQKYVGWAFPALLVFGVTRLPESSLISGALVTIGLLVVITGWQSFGIIEERLYNDLLLFVDLALLSSYWLLLYYAGRGETDPRAALAVLHISGMICFLYATWDVAALVGRDTSALATAAHLQRFAGITFGLGVAFFAIALAADWLNQVVGSDVAALTSGAAVWILLITWWQVGRWMAAVQDSGSSAN